MLECSCLGGRSVLISHVAPEEGDATAGFGDF